MTNATIAQFAAALADGAAVIDVREPNEYVAGHVPGARLVPLGQLPARLPELHRHEPVFVICASGNRSAMAADHLRRAGFDARSVEGGTSAWTSSGRPVVLGTRTNAA